MEFADDETGVGGIASVSTDATIDGDGTPSDALGLADNAVTTPKILDEAVTLAKLASGISTQLNSIANKLDTVATDTSLDGDGTATDPLVLADDAVTTSKILNDAVTYDKVSQAIVDQLNLISEKLASVATDASIGGDGTTTDPLSLADDAVTTSKILNDAVTYDKVSQAIVDQLNLISEKLALVATDTSLDGTGVGSDPLSLADNSVSTIKIQDRAVTNLKLAQTIVDDIDSKLDAVLTDSTLDGNGSNIPLSLADDAVSTVKVQDEAITQDKLSPDVVTLLTQSEEGGLMAVASDSSLAGVGTSDSPLRIADDGVTTPKILDLNVTGPKLADDSVSTIKVIDQAITEAKLHPDVVAQLGDNENLLSSVASDASLDGDGTTGDPLSLADDAVTAPKILNGAVSRVKLDNLLTEDLDSKLETVATNTTIDGDGTAANPLALANGSVNRLKLNDALTAVIDGIPDNFTDLDDTPTALGTNGQILQVNTAEDALEFVDKGLTTVETSAPVSGDGTASDPVTIDNGTIRGVHIAANADISGGSLLDGSVVSEKLEDDSITEDKLHSSVTNQLDGIPDNITDLDDVPNSLGDAGQTLKVNLAGTALIFADDSEGTDGITSVASDASLDGDGTTSDPLSLADNAVTESKILNRAVSRAKLDDLLTADLDSKLENVLTDSTLDGNGSNIPLGVADNSVDRAKLAASVRTELDDIPDSLTDLSDTPAALGNSGQILKMNTAGTALEFTNDETGMEGFTSVSTDSTLDGDGTASNPLGLADDSVSTIKVIDQAITEAKLHPDVVAQLGDNENLLSSVATNASIDGDGTTGDPLSLADDAVGTDNLQDNAVERDKIVDGAVSGPKVSTGAISRVKLDQALLDDLDSKLENVLTDSTIDGNGSNIPLSVADNSVDRSKLSASVRTELDSIPSDVPDNFTDLDDTPASLGSAGQVIKVNPDGNGLIFANDETGMEGFTSAATDSTLDGDGTASTPLGLADDSVSTIKVIDQAITEAKLHPDVVAQLGDNENLLSSVASDSSLDGDGTTGSPLSLADDSVSPDKLQDNAVERDKIVDGAVSGPKVSTGAISRVKLDQALIDDLDSKLETVTTDSTIDGNGDDDPLGIAIASVDRLRLAEAVTDELDAIPDNFTDLDDTPAVLGNAGQVIKVNPDGDGLIFANDETGMEGFTSAATDSTLDGDGTASTPLGLADDAVSTPKILDEAVTSGKLATSINTQLNSIANKLDSVASDSTIDGDGTSGTPLGLADDAVTTVKVIDQAITEAKLHPDVVAQLGDNENLLSSVATDASIDGDGTDASPLSLADDSVSPDKLQDNAVEQDKIVDGAVSGPKVSTGAISRVKLDQALLDDLDSKLETVATDSTIDGNGSNIPLSVADNSVDRSKLAASVRTELDSIPDDVPDNLTDLDDTPTALGTTGQILQVNSGATALEFVNQQSGGATAFTGLTDTPANLGSANQIIQVNDSGNALDYIDNTDTGFDLKDLQNVTEIDDNDEIGVSKVTVPETARNSDRETILGTTEFENASVTAGTTHVVEDVSGTQYIILSTVNTLPVIQIFEIGVGGTLIDRTSGIAPQFVSGVYAAGDQLGPIYNIGDKYALINVTKETILVLNKTLPNRLTFDTAHPLHNFSIEAANPSDTYSFGGVLFYKRYLYFRDSLAGAGESTHTFLAVNVDTGVAEDPPRNLDHLISDAMLFDDAASVTNLQVSQDEFFIFLSANATNTLGIKYLADGTDVPDVKNRYVDAFTHYREQVAISSTLTLALNITVDSGFLYFQFRNADGTRTSFVYDVSEETVVENKKILVNHVRAEIVENASITQLRDIPALGTTGQFLQVNAAEDGMLFRDLPPGFDIDDLQDTTEIDGDDEIAFRKITPPDNPRNSAREDVFETSTWQGIQDADRGGAVIWETVGGVNYILVNAVNNTDFRVYELSGATTLIDRTADLSPETLVDSYTVGNFLNNLIDIGDYYVTVNTTENRMLVLNKTLPDRLTFNVDHPLHGVDPPVETDGFFTGFFQYDGYLYFLRRVVNGFRTLNISTGVAEEPTVNLDYLLDATPLQGLGGFDRIGNLIVIQDEFFAFGISGGGGTNSFNILNLEDATPVPESSNPFLDAKNAFDAFVEANPPNPPQVVDISFSNNFLYFYFIGVTNADRHSFVYDVSGETRIENLKIPFENFRQDVLSNTSVTELADVASSLGDAGAPLLVNSAGDALEFGNELQLRNISPNQSATDVLNSVVTYELNYNLENFRGRNLYIRINIDPNPDIELLGSLVVRRTWESWTKRVSEVADSRPNNITTLDLTALNTNDYDLFILPVVLRDGTSVPISFFRHPDNALGNTVLALGYHNVDLEFRNIGFWII